MDTNPKETFGRARSLIRRAATTLRTSWAGRVTPASPSIPPEGVKAGEAISCSFGQHKFVVERIEASSSPIVRVIGWSESDVLPPFFIEQRSGHKLPPHGVYRESRRNLKRAGETSHPHAGFIAEFYANDVAFVICGDARLAIPNADRVGTRSPHYDVFFKDDQFLRREQVYGIGDPVDTNQEVLDLCGALTGSILDFGCGNGDLVRRLHQLGREAHGIEISSERIRSKIKPEAQPFVTLYDGQFPMPYPDQAFDFVLATEVVEHIPNPECLPAEFARLTRRGLLVTVPDMTSIPSGYEHGVVPWHLLEASHLNFFTAKSLARLFDEFFVPEELYRIGTRYVNGRMLAGSVGVRFVKRELGQRSA